MALSKLPSRIHKEFKEQFLTCSLCVEPYDNNKHQAKFLPCLHSYCKSCLQQYAGVRLKFNCPECRTETKLADGTIDSLPNNFVVENLKEYQDIFKLAAICGSCDDHSKQTVSFCRDCVCYLCEGCTDSHKLRPLRHHNLSTMTKLQEEKIIPKMPQRCKKHPTMSLNLYCKEANCKVSVCASCGLVDHRGHEIIDLEAAISEKVSDIRQSCTNIAARNQELTRTHAAVDTMQKTLTDNFTQKEQAMQRSVEELHSLIDSRYNKEHSNLKHLHKAEMKRLTETNESIEFLATQMTSACEFANKACEMSNSTQLLTSEEQIKIRLNELENSQLPASPATGSDKTDFALTAKHHSAIVQIEDSLQYLCDVDWFTNHRVPEEEFAENQELQTNDPVITKERELTILQYRYNDMEGKLNQLQKENVERTAANATMQTLLQDQEEKVQHVKTLLIKMCGDDLQDSQSQLKNAVEDKQNEIQALKNNTARTIKEEQDRARKGLEVVRGQNNRLEQELNRVKKTMKEKLAAYKERIEQLEYELKVDPSRCTIQLGQSAGLPLPGLYTAIVQTVGFNGKLIKTGGAKVTATRPYGVVQRSVQDNKDGTYTIRYRPANGHLHVNINGTPMKGSPFITFLYDKKAM